MKNYDVIVVGAGFTGSVFAREMANNGKRVLLIEKRSHIGGNMYEDLHNDVRVHRYGPHIFHTNSARVFDYLKQYSKFYPYEHKVRGRIDGKLVPIPFNFESIDMLFPLQQACGLKQKLTGFFDSKRISIYDLLNSPDSEIHVLGQYVFDKVFANYTSKQWGISADQIDRSVINRVPVVLSYDGRYFQDIYQAMPQDGFTVLFERLLDHPNIDVVLSQAAQDRLILDFQQRTIRFDGSLFSGIVLLTGALDEFLEYRYGALPYRSLDLIFESKNCDYYQQSVVVNYPNEEAFTRITEFKHLTGQVVEGKTTILKEFPLPFDKDKAREPYYPITDKTSEALYQKYISLISEFQNIYLCGRLAEYKYYNMDVVIDRALILADQILERPEIMWNNEESQPFSLTVNQYGKIHS